MKDKVNFVNGKWSLSAKAKESGDYAYHEGDWHYRGGKKLQKKIQKKSQPIKKKMNCVGFPSGKIRSTLEVLGVYLVSSVLGVSLAFNVFLFMHTRSLENQNLQLIEILDKK